MRYLLLAAVGMLALSATSVQAADTADPYAARVAKVLKKTPVIDGHNDWPMTLVEKAGDGRWTLPLETLDTTDYDTDITRLHRGMVGGQFWSVYVSARLPQLEQVKTTIEQIDLVHQIVRRYPDTFQIATTAADVRKAFKAGRIASMIGVEGGGQIDDSFSVLRTYKEMGAGYLTLTHGKTIAWADSATDDPQHDGLTKFGEAVVLELNRLGMLVDLSHVSEATMLDALAVTKAPVIFSHSSARAICGHPRNVPDNVLKLVAQNGGIVMVNFAPGFISEKRRQWAALRAGEQARLASLHAGYPDRAKTALVEWEQANPQPVVTVSDVADHVDHIAKVAGVDHVGLGADYDGLPELPQGMDGVESYPALMAELMRRGWSDSDIAKLASGNILRVMEAAEKVATSLKTTPAATATLAQLDGTPEK